MPRPALEVADIFRDHGPAEGYAWNAPQGDYSSERSHSALKCQTPVGPRSHLIATGRPAALARPNPSIRARSTCANRRKHQHPDLRMDELRWKVTSHQQCYRSLAECIGSQDLRSNAIKHFV